MASKSHFHLMKCPFFFKKITIFTKYLIRSLKIFIELSIRPILKGENHIRKLGKYLFEIYFHLGLQISPQNDNILNIRAFWGYCLPPNKHYFQKNIFLISWYVSYLYKNGLIEYSMNIFSDLRRYFVKVIFLKFFWHFIRWNRLS